MKCANCGKPATHLEFFAVGIRERHWKNLHGPMGFNGVCYCSKCTKKRMAHYFMLDLLKDRKICYPGHYMRLPKICSCSFQRG